MLYQGEKAVLSKLTVWLFLAVSFFSSGSFAQEKYIVPAMCVGRANEIGVFINKDSVHTNEALAENYKGQRDIDYNAIDAAYRKTLAVLNEQLEREDSELFKYLVSCRNSEESCHNYFTPTNPLHLRLFCDAEIYQGLTKADFRTNNQAVEQIIKVKVKKQPKLLDLDTAQQTQDEIVTIHKKIENVVNNQVGRLVKNTQDAMKASVFEEGFRYILQKVNEDFRNWHLHDKMKQSVEQYFSLYAMAREFKSCCENHTLLADYQVSASYVVDAGKQIESQLKPLPYLVFNVQDARSAYLMDVAEAEYWKKRFATQSPLAMKDDEQLRFFRYLKAHPFFFRNKSSGFAEAKKSIKENPKADFGYRLLDENGKKEWERQVKEYRNDVFKIGFSPDMVAYKDSLKYKPTKSLYPDDNPYGDPRGGRAFGPMDFNTRKFAKDRFMYDMIFDPNFSYEYMQQLSQNVKIDQQNQLDQVQEMFYRKLFKGFVPYAFGRAAKAKLVRELQKYKQSIADTMIIKSDATQTGEQKFKSWAENVICNSDYLKDSRESHDRVYTWYKSNKLKDTYCAPVMAADREKTYTRLHQAIIKGEIKLKHLSENGAEYRRKNLYDEQYRLSVNQKITAVNDYCWKNYDKKGFEKNPKKFEERKDFQAVLEGFYAAVGEEVMGQTDFADTFDFEPMKVVENCFTEGVVFGDLENHYSFRPAPPPLPWIWTSHSKSKFQLDSYDIKIIEMNIERKLNDEFRDLDTAARSRKVKNMQEFLEESASFRTLSMIEYAQDHPSEQIGKFICRLISSASDTEASRLAKIKIITTLVMVVGTAVCIFSAPLLLAGTMSLVETGSVLVLVGTGVAASQYQIALMKRKDALLDQSVITKSMYGQDAMMLHAMNDAKIDAARMEQVIGSVAMLALAARPIMASARFLSNLANSEVRFQTALRMVNLEHYVRVAGLESKYFLSKKFTEFFTKKVAQEDAYSFMRLLNNRKVTTQEIEDFITSKWGSELGDIAAIKSAMKPSWFARAITQPIVSATVSFFNKPIFFQAKSLWLRFWIKVLEGKSITKLSIRAKFYDALALEAKLVGVFNKAIDLSSKNGKKIFSETEIDELAAKLKFFKRDVDGKFYRVFEEDFMNARTAFMQKQPLYQVNAEYVEDYMKRTLNEELMSRDEWMFVFENFTRQIKTKEDLKSLLKIVKFAKREYTGVMSKIRNLKELTNFREISGSVVYRDRAEDILKNIDGFFDIAQTIKYKSNIKTNRLLKDFAQANGKTREEVINAIDEKFYKYGQKIEGQSESLLERLERTSSPPQNLINESQIAGKYQKQFWKQEMGMSDYFHKVLGKNLKRSRYGIDQIDSFAESYFRASIKASERKTLINECTHPSSIVRGDVQNLYKKFLIYISMSASGLSYAAAHRDEPKDLEWMARISFDVFGAYFINKFVFMPVYSSKNQSPIIRDFMYYPMMVGVGTLVDGAMYQATIQNAYNDDDRYREEFEKMIYQSENVEETVKQYFVKYPDMEANITARLQTLEDVFQKIKNERPDNMTAKDAEEIFVKSGLVESYFTNQALKGSDYRFPDRSMYQHYVNEGLIDADMFSTDEATEDQLIDIMTDIVYQDIRNHGSLNPRPVGEGDGFIFDRETSDRMGFNLGTYELVHTPAALIKNSLVYQSICYGRYLPAPASIVMGLGAYTMYKGLIEPWKFEARDEQTGH